jgi:hypothetical protein
MNSSGNHTWNITIKYHQCPKCGLIIESRDDYKYQMGKYTKNVHCSRCKNDFTLLKNTIPQCGPLFGEPTSIEWDWENKKI